MSLCNEVFSEIFWLFVWYWCCYGFVVGGWGLDVFLIFDRRVV